MPRAVRSALRASYSSVAWGVLSGVAEVVVGAQTASLALAGVGATVLVDLLSSVVLVWRFRAELHAVLRGDEARSHERAEARAQQVASTGLLVIGLVLVAGGMARIATGGGAHPDALAVSLAAVSIPVLAGLAWWKYAAARQAGSTALTTDAHISSLGAATSALTLAGLALTQAAGVTWADPLAAAVVGVVAAFEGRRGLRH